MAVQYSAATVVLSFLSVSPALGRCPTYQLGITFEDGTPGRKVYATNKAEALMEGEDSQKLATIEARVSARAALARHPQVPKSAVGRLRGVTDMEVCHVDRIVYVTIMLDEANARRAISLEDAMTKSLQNALAAPLPTSEIWDAEMKDIFGRLIMPAPEQ